MRKQRCGLVLLLALLSCRSESDIPVRVMLTRGVAASGVPAVLMERFGRSNRVAFEVSEVSGEAVPRIDFKEDPAVVFTSDAEVLARLAPVRRLSALVAREDFVIIGPESDPAGVRLAGNAAEAFRRIHEGKRAFCSAVDIPLWNGREREIWRAAELDPDMNPRYRACRGDARRVVEDTASRRGYTVIHATSAGLIARSEAVAVLKYGGPLLRTDYWVVLASGRRRTPKNAEWFVKWAMTRDAREAIAGIAATDAHRVTPP